MATKPEDKFAAFRLCLGKKFSDGVTDAEVRGFVEHHAVKNKFGPAFLVNYGRPNVSHYVNADDFLKEFKVKE